MDYLVNAIGHVQLNVVDVDALVKESTEILGLHVTHQTDKEVWLSCSGRKAELVLHESDENSVRSVGFDAVSKAAVAEAASRVEDAGCRIVSNEPTLACCETGVVFHTPQGLQIEVHSPIEDDIYGRRHASPGVGALRLDHVNLTSPDPAETRTQFERIMGLRLSERMVDDSLSWMRGANRLHHCVGIVKGDVGLHHYSFEMGEFADYCRLGDRLDTIEKNFIWGPGRHRPGDNTYAYFINSCGAMVECSGGMAMILDDDRYEPNVITALKRPDNVRVMNVWGEPAPLVWREHKFPWAKLV
ncbi:VOC family protein [Frigidibacter sp. ROC022]|uniref:VOC family protein n=1 Tax=Frigidibacter sp. ROC022 TaxID=2971796 RepID=UPI00215AA19A|nr:VOC family protein [Frigidibacter sp. ROC022]MCR8724650.1 VOC family protein [Frigidibacter sp. ROC022]